MASKRQLLLTGLPNCFLARRLLGELASSPANQVICLVTPDAEKKLLQHLDGLTSAQRGRVELLHGDVAAMDFGLSGQAFLDLARRVHQIYHCPLVTQPGVDRKLATALNIGGTGEVLELAEAAPNLERIVYFSSALVSGARRGHALESELVAPREHRNAVEETLFRAEKMMLDASDHVPVTILRPAIIVGDSRTGEIDRLEGPYLLILLMLNAPPDLRVPLPGRGDAALNLVPIDYVVEASCAIANDPRTVGQTFNLVDGNPLSARQVFELVAKKIGRPGPVGSLPTQIATALLRAPGLERFSHIPRAFIEQLATSIEYDDRNTREALAGTGIRCPSAEGYLGVMVEHVRREQRLDPKKAKGRRKSSPPDMPADDVLEPTQTS